jgi:G3E family GTPase
MAETEKIAKARYYMIGGFLGAGKTTMVSQFATYLKNKRLRVGLITNDQGQQLVDTAMLRSRGFATEEISGGCFCCRFNSLVDAANKLSRETRPDVFVAEPVGSCTDLVATVSYPLRRIYGENFTVAPLAVLLDPNRAARVFGLATGPGFSSRVNYVYRKQVEEADCLVLNKVDSVSADLLQSLTAFLEREFPGKVIFKVSGRTGAGLPEFFNYLAENDQSSKESISIDYDTYAEGEALLGWLNATLSVQSQAEFNANEFVRAFTSHLQEQLKRNSIEVAHLKMTFDPNSIDGSIAVINLVRSDFVPELSQELEDLVTTGNLVVNLRAEADATVLLQALQSTIEQARQFAPTVTLSLQHQEHFQPGRPQPTHRDLAGR